VLGDHREHVRVTVPLTTCDRRLQRTLEPWTAPPRLRLRQVAALRRLGVPVQAALDPLLPGLTDTRDNLTAVLTALAGRGTRHVPASSPCRREGIAGSMTAAWAPHGLAPTLLAEFAGGPVLTAPGLAGARYLPRARRQRGYAALMGLAAEHGITVSV